MVQDAKAAGQLDYQQAAEFTQTLADVVDSGRELVEAGKRLRVKRQACGICRQVGHNRRTCPSR